MRQTEAKKRRAAEICKNLGFVSVNLYVYLLIFRQVQCTRQGEIFKINPTKFEKIQP